MEMVLMGGCLSLLGLAVVCLAFGAATRSGEPEPAAEPVAQAALTPAAAHFFAPNIPARDSHSRACRWKRCCCR